MNITRDVITDLLPVYFSGEASDDTQALVEKFFEEDPEFARLARTDVDQLVGQLDTTHNLEDDEMTALRKTKQLLRQRSMLLGFAICFSVLPFSFHGSSNSDHVQWIFAGNSMAISIFASMAFICWIGYALLHRRVRTSGL